MPALKNNRWELFAQAIAQGKTAEDAYTFAGYRENRGNATRLKANEAIKLRVAEIMRPLQKKVEATVERLAERLGNISLARVTDYVKIVNGKLIIEDTDKLPPELADAIASIKPGKDGIEVKFLDPLHAIRLLGNHKGMFKENVNLTVQASLSDLVNLSYQAADKGSDKA